MSAIGDIPFPEHNVVALSLLHFGSVSNQLAGMLYGSVRVLGDCVP